MMETTETKGTNPVIEIADELRARIGDAPAGLPGSIGRTLVGEAGTVEREDGEPYTPPIVGQGRGFLDTYDHVINPYVGCGFGCSYCYASNFARRDDGGERNLLEDQWGGWVQAKTSALDSMMRTRTGRLNGKNVYMSSVTDPYQPVERYAEITRGLLEVIAEQHPKIRLVIQTRSNLVVRDADLFAVIRDQGGRVQVNITTGTDDEAAVRHFEPGCQPVRARTGALAKLNEAGITTCATITPMLPMRDPAGFIQQLADAGTARFIIQPFHTPRDPRSQFVASTDTRALELMAQWYGLDDHKKAGHRYNMEYIQASREIRSAVAAIRVLEQHGSKASSLAELGETLRSVPGATLGVGKAGFAPPF